MKDQYGLTKKQRAFADHIINNPKDSATKAVEQTYAPTTKSAATSIAHENLTKPDIMAYLAEHDVAAQNIIVEVMSNSSILKDEPAHARLALDSAKEVLNRVHGLPVARHQIQSTTVNLNLDLTTITEQTEQPEQ